MALSERQHYRGSVKQTRQRDRGSFNPFPMHQNLSYKRLETNPIETLSTFEIFMKTKINESNMSNNILPLREPLENSRRMSIGQTLPSLMNNDGFSTDISQKKVERETVFQDEKKTQRKNSQLSGLKKIMLMQQPMVAKSHLNSRAKSMEKFGNTLQKIGAQAQSNLHISRGRDLSNTPPNLPPPTKPSSDSLRTSKHELKIRRSESVYASTGNNNNDSTTRNDKLDTQLIAYDSMKSFYANMSSGNLTSNREYLDKKEYENDKVVLKQNNIDLTEITDDYQLDKQESDIQKAINEKLFAPPALPKFIDDGVEIKSIERLQLLDSFRSRKAPNSHRNKSTFHSKRPSILPSDVINASQASILNNSIHHVQKPNPKSKPLSNVKGDYLPDWLGQRKDFQEACKHLVTQTKQIVPIACSKPSYSRTIEEIEAITIWLLKIKVFRSLPRRIVETISEKVKLREYQRNEALCHQGDQGDCLYIIFSGTVRCLVDGVQVAVYKAGDAMGQTALDGATPRTATLVAATPSQILRLESEDYKFTMEYYALKQRDDFLATLKKVKIFEDMDPNKQTIIVAALQSKYYTKGEVIYNEGGNSEALYILRKGKVQLESRLEIGKENLWPAGTNLWEKLIVKRNAKFSHLVDTNHFFGEIEILKNCKRLHSAVCVEDCQVLILSKRDFFGLLDPDDMAKAKYLVKDTLLQDADRMKKKVIETENHKKKMKEVMIKALSDQLSSLNSEALKKRSKNLVEPGIQRVNQNLKSFIKSTTINAVPRYEIVHSNLE